MLDEGMKKEAKETWKRARKPFAHMRSDINFNFIDLDVRIFRLSDKEILIQMLNEISLYA